MIRLFSSLLISFALASCDAGFSVIISNKSYNDRQIKIVEMNKYGLQFIDSMLVSDTSDRYFSSNKIESRTKDTSNNSYSFVLEKGKQALLQSGIGSPDSTQQVIIDYNDTILLKKDKRCVIKRKPWSTSVVITVD